MNPTNTARIARLVRTYIASGTTGDDAVQLVASAANLDGGTVRLVCALEGVEVPR